MENRETYKHHSGQVAERQKLKEVGKRENSKLGDRRSVIRMTVSKVCQWGHLLAHEVVSWGHHCRNTRRMTKIRLDKVMASGTALHQQRGLGGVADNLCHIFNASTGLVRTRKKYLSAHVSGDLPGDAFFIPWFTVTWDPKLLLQTLSQQL